MGSKKGQKITISGDEFADVIEELVHEYYNRIISDDEVYLALNLKNEKKNVFSLELSIVLSIIAIRLFSIRHNNINLKAYARERILKKNETDIFKFKEDDINTYEELFDKRYNMFSELIPEQKSSFEIRSQLLGFTRYLISQFSDKPEDDNKEIITKCSTYIVEFGDIISRLIANSRLKVTSAWTGKYEFIVTK